jgi:dienelactone hydrolase
MEPAISRARGAAARRSRSKCAAAVLLAVVATAAGTPLAPAADAHDRRAPACAGDLGDPVPGTAAWEQADLDNRRCAAEGLRIIQDNPAVAAAREANAAAGEGHFLGDPFRAPHRWAGQRGSYELTTYTDRDGNERSAALFGPLDPDRGPYPGVLLVCHACALFPTVEYLSAWYWAAETLAEAGYVVMYADVAGNSISRAVDATDFFAATPEAPTAGREFNPWHERLDAGRLGIVGHSGAGGVALNVGYTDPRYDAIVAWDPAGPSLAGVTPRIPTMIQVADYPLSTGPVPRVEKPSPTPGSKYTYFDTIRTAGVDTMQVALRASTHLDWQHFPSDPGRPHSIYGEMVATYYTLAWLDRYLSPSRLPWARSPDGALHASPSVRPALSRLVALDALRRLTTTGTGRFDRSADVHSIGTGFFDANRAERAGHPEAGNVPITIRGLPVRNLLSLHYDSRYYLEDGALQCEDMRARCPRPRPHG